MIPMHIGKMEQNIQKIPQLVMVRLFHRDNSRISNVVMIVTYSTTQTV